MTVTQIQKYKKKSIPQLIKLATKYFNKFIRQRDKICISCGAGVDHAGHYLSAGHHSAHRFNELNTNGKCLRCNNFLHWNLINYRKGLVKKIGLERVEILEGTAHKPFK